MSLDRYRARLLGAQEETAHTVLGTLRRRRSELEAGLSLCWDLELSEELRGVLIRTAALPSHLYGLKWHAIPGIERARLLEAAAAVLALSERLSGELA